MHIILLNDFMIIDTVYFSEFAEATNADGVMGWEQVAGLDIPLHVGAVVQAFG